MQCRTASCPGTRHGWIFACRQCRLCQFPPELLLLCVHAPLHGHTRRLHARYVCLQLLAHCLHAPLQQGHHGGRRACRCACANLSAAGSAPFSLPHRRQATHRHAHAPAVLRCALRPSPCRPGPSGAAPPSSASPCRRAPGACAPRQTPAGCAWYDVWCVAMVGSWRVAMHSCSDACATHLRDGSQLLQQRRLLLGQRVTLLLQLDHVFALGALATHADASTHTAPRHQALLLSPRPQLAAHAGNQQRHQLPSSTQHTAPPAPRCRPRSAAPSAASAWPPSGAPAPVCMHACMFMCDVTSRQHRRAFRRLGGPYPSSCQCGTLRAAAARTQPHTHAPQASWPWLRAPPCAPPTAPASQHQGRPPAGGLGVTQAVALYAYLLVLAAQTQHASTSYAASPPIRRATATTRAPASP